MPEPFPPGHFYSPVIDLAAVVARARKIWPSEPEALGIDFNDPGQLSVLEEIYPRYLRDYDYPEELPDGAPEWHFFTRNSQFSWLDARTLFVLMRHWRPRRVIEVGSGFSSLLMADVNRRFLDGTCAITCIEPFPRPFLQAGVPGIERVLVEEVQDVALDEYQQLQDGDVLFIDSSHVSKTGSDVNHLYFEVLPRLAAGVHIHIHDVFLPSDYPPDWVLEEERSWNEQYLVRALLMYSTVLRVEFGCSYASIVHPDEVAAALGREPGAGFGGGSLWLTKTA